MSKSIDRWYSIASVAQHLDLCKRTVRRRALSGEFGQVIDLGPAAGVRVSGSGINAALASAVVPVGDRSPAEDEIEPGTPARTPGELRRKVGARVF